MKVFNKKIVRFSLLITVMTLVISFIPFATIGAQTGLCPTDVGVDYDEYTKAYDDIPGGETEWEYTASCNEGSADIVAVNVKSATNNIVFTSDGTQNEFTVTGIDGNGATVKVEETGEGQDASHICVYWVCTEDGNGTEPSSSLDIDVETCEEVSVLTCADGYNGRVFRVGIFQRGVTDLPRYKGTIGSDEWCENWIEDLEPGDYQAKFQIANEAGDGIEVEVSKDFTVSECSEPEPPVGDLLIYKYSGDQPLGGAVFDVVDGNGFAAKLTTGADGFASIADLAPGIYYVKEVIPPEGYDIDPNQYTVTVPEEGSGRVDVENDPLPTPSPAPPAEGGEVEVLGVSEELPYTGYNWIYYIIGFGLMVSAGAASFLMLRSKRQSA